MALPTLRYRFIVVTIVAAAGVCAPGCARQVPEPVQTALRIGIGAPPVPTPGSGAATVINSLVSDPWLTNKPDGHQSERIAKSWEWDESGTKLRLKLRNDVLFHDGTPLTAALGAEALRRTKANYIREAFSFRDITAIEPIGADVIEITLAAPNSFIVQDLSAVLVAKPKQPRVGTGPFRLVSQTDQEANLAAFPNYYRGHPAIAQVKVINYPTQRKTWAAMMRGDIDMLHEVSREAVEFVEAETSVNTYSFPRPYYIPLTFNIRHPVLRDVRVRRAINQAVDRTALVREGLRGRGSPSDGPISPLNWAYVPPARPFTYNPAAARTLLDEAGYPARPNREAAVPIRFAFKCLVFAEDPRFDRIALLVQRQLADVGIDMQLVPVPLVQIGVRAAAGDFEAFVLEMSGRSLSRVYEFWRSREGAMVDSGYMAADAVLDRIRAARTDDEVRAGAADLNRVMHDDPPAAFLVWQETSRAVLGTFDVIPEEKRDIFTNLWLWRPAAALKQARK